jgi:hypothetical protein
MEKEDRASHLSGIESDYVVSIFQANFSVCMTF